MGVCRATVYNWAKENPEFLDAKKRAYQLAKGKWIGIGMTAAVGKIPGFQMGAFAMIMKNCFGWEDNPQLREDEVDELEFV